jgi:Asp/Glu/hydantoin racemase
VPVLASLLDREAHRVDAGLLACADPDGLETFREDDRI